MQDLFTAQDYRVLPEGFPAQLVAGALVREPAPTYGHGRVVLELAALLRPQVPRGCVVVAPVDVPVDEHNVFQPDVVVVGARPPDDAASVPVPRLVIEVLSPTTAVRDRSEKCPRLLALGVLEVWLVDPGARLIEVHTRRGCEAFTGTDRAASRAVPGFQVSAAMLEL